MMPFKVIVCVDREYGYARDNKLPWTISGEIEYYQKTIQEHKPGYVNAFIIGSVSWEKASERDKHIMTQGLCCVISNRSSLLFNENINIFPTILAAQSFLDAKKKIHPIDTVYIVGGREIILECINNNIVDVCLVSRLAVSFDSNKFLPELQTLLPAHYFCAEQTYHTNPDSLDFIVEQWVTNKPRTIKLKHLCYDLMYIVEIENTLDTAVDHKAIHLLKFIIDSIYQYGNTELLQHELMQLISFNCSRVFAYLVNGKSTLTVRVEHKGHVVYELNNPPLNIIRKEIKSWGWVDVIYENRWLNCVVHVVPPQQSLPNHHHPIMLEREMLCEGRLKTYYDSGPLTEMPPFTAIDRFNSTLHGYLNDFNQDGKFIGISDRIFKEEYEVCVDGNPVPNTLDSRKLNCLCLGSGEIILAGSTLLQSHYNIISVDKTPSLLTPFFIPANVLSFSDMLQVTTALSHTQIDLLIIASDTYSSSHRKDQHTYAIEESIQANYLAPALLLLDLINHNLINKQTKIIFTSSSKGDIQLCPNCPQLTPEQLLGEPENYSSERQYAISKFAVDCAVRRLFELGYTISTVYFEKNKPVNEAWLALVQQTQFESFYYDFYENLPVNEAVLTYDCARLWDYTRQFYLTIKQKPQKMRLAASRPLCLWTWNIYGIKQNIITTSIEQRMHYLLEKIKDEQPDIICLQEVTYELWSKYLEPFSKINAYRLSPMPSDIDNYPDTVFVATLSRLYVVDEQLIKLKNTEIDITPLFITNESMQQPVLRELPIDKDYYALYQQYEHFSIINLHLIAGEKYQQCRELQVQQLFSSVKSDEKIIIMGDFNCDLNTIKIMPPTYHDLWDILITNDKGYTEDIESNAIRKIIKQNAIKKISKRVDGIFIPPSLEKKCSSIKRLGIEAIRTGQFISDHYGVACILDNRCL